MYIKGWWGVAIFLLGEIIFILLEILNFTTLLQPKLKHYSQRWWFSITWKFWFSANCTGTWCPQQVHFLGQLMFYYLNMTSTYLTVWKLSKMPSCIPPLFGTRYLSTLSMAQVWCSGKHLENWDVELLSRNLRQNSFTSTERWACPAEDSIQQCYHSLRYI